MRLIVGPERHWRAGCLLRGADALLLRSPDAPPVEAGRALELRFNDIAEPRPGLVAPDAQIVARILAFGAAPRTLAIHCYAGVSRSTAAAYALACQHAGPGSEERLALDLRRLSPAATPNSLMVALADDALNRAGRMSAAIAAIGRGAEAFEGPLFEWRLDPHPAGD
ncbi:MAG: protein tyrosine phosphatase [Phenylobacterium zucineum]|nr:MAG: protein tyrosine phosphatase [Phenylobacterium zucineum]